MEKLLKLENVSYSYQDGKEKNKILEHVSYSFEKGKIYAVVGASGTGKSYELNKEAKECFGKDYERVTFHPNYMYGNFIGAYKPFPKVLKNSDVLLR